MINKSDKRFKIDRIYNVYSDYNSILIYGAIASISNDELKIYRSLPSVPPIIPIGREVVVDDNVKNIIESNNLSGFVFQKVKYKKVILVEWFDWKINQEPVFIPESGEPFGYFSEMPSVEKKFHPHLWRLVTYSDGNEDLALRNGELTFSRKAISVLGEIESPITFRNCP